MSTKKNRTQMHSEQRKNIWDNLVKRPDTITVDPDSIVHMDWSKEWNGGKLPQKFVKSFGPKRRR